ncbi:hypothetical protein V5799_030275, partial [Amblyomma americanum]
ELTKKNVGQGSSGSKLWHLQRFLATLPTNDASTAQEAACRQEAAATDLVPNTVRGRVEYLEHDLESSSESSSLSSSSESLSQRGMLVAELLEEQRKRRMAFEKLQEKEFAIKEQQLKLMEASAEREIRLIALLDELFKK